MRDRHRTGMTRRELLASAAAPLTVGAARRHGHHNWPDRDRPGVGIPEDFLAHIQVAKPFDVKNLIGSLGKVQPPDRRSRREARRVLLPGAAEPRSAPRHDGMTALTSQEAFETIEAVDHPHVRIDFDLYHRQLGEGNVIDTLREGLRKGWSRFVEIGDVPGRQEPGTGEDELRQYLSCTARRAVLRLHRHGTRHVLHTEHAMDVVRKLAGV